MGKSFSSTLILRGGREGPTNETEDLKGEKRDRDSASSGSSKALTVKQLDEASSSLLFLRSTSRRGRRGDDDDGDSLVNLSPLASCHVRLRRRGEVQCPEVK